MGPPGPDRIQVGPMLAPWTLLPGLKLFVYKSNSTLLYTHAIECAPRHMCIKSRKFPYFCNHVLLLCKARKLDFGCHQNFCTICYNLINFVLFSSHIRFWTNIIFIAPTCEYSDIIVFNICGSISDVKHCFSLVIMRCFVLIFNVPHLSMCNSIVCSIVHCMFR